MISLNKKGFELLFIGFSLTLVCLFGMMICQDKLSETISEGVGGMNRDLLIFIAGTIFSIGVTVAYSAIELSNAKRIFWFVVCDIFAFLIFEFFGIVFNDFFISAAACLIGAVAGLMFWFSSKIQIFQYLFYLLVLLFVAGFYSGMAASFGEEFVRCILYPSVLSFFIAGIYRIVMNRGIPNLIILLFSVVVEAFLVSYYGIGGYNLVWCIYLFVMFYIKGCSIN